MKNLFYLLALVTFFAGAQTEIPSFLNNERFDKFEAWRHDSTGQQQSVTEPKLKTVQANALVCDSIYYYSFNTIATDSVNFGRAYYRYDARRNLTSYASFYLRNNEWIGSDRTEYVYDINGKTTSVTKYNYDKYLKEWTRSKKDEYAYDTEGNLTMSANYYTYSDNQWQGSYKQEYAYVNKKRVLFIVYMWNGSLWVPRGKDEMSYDIYGNQTSITSNEWSSVLNQWVHLTKSQYEYDDNGNQTSKSLFNWNKDENQWVKKESYTYSFTYVSHGKPTVISGFSYDFSSNQWLKYSKTEYTYNTYGYETLRVECQWNSLTSQWIGINKYETAYDEKGYGILYIDYDWDLNANQWVENVKYTNINNDKGNVLENMYYVWSINENKWIENSKNEYAYDANGNQTMFCAYKWDRLTSQWIEDQKFIRAFDSNGNLKVASSYYWNSDLNQYVQNSKGYYYYSIPVISELGTPASGAIRLYPNPARNLVYFNSVQDNARVQIYNLSGSLVLDKLNITNTLDISSLNKGMYSVVITDKAGTSNSKIMKE